MKYFSTISLEFLKKITSIIGTIFVLVFLFFCFEIYVPVNPSSNETIIYTVQKGWGDSKIADNLKELGIIRSSYFLQFYAVLSLKHSTLQAGEYSLSSKMSIHEIVNKMTRGDIIRNKVIVLEGWNIQNIGEYLESKDICKKDYFVSLTKSDYSDKFDFLADKPKKEGIEGYLFPDTYEVGKKVTCEDVVNAMLVNFGKKLTVELRAEIKNQKKSIFDIITVASMIEKEVRSLEDKKIVSGIIWKRLAIGMPLQIDATIVYITGNPNIFTKDKSINSPYNTYKYYGLPKGPISNPGINSITSAIYPTKTNYLFYLTDGITHFSETLEQHNAARLKYLND
jgi:UPF0755 protein